MRRRLVPRLSLTLLANGTAHRHAAQYEHTSDVNRHYNDHRSHLKLRKDPKLAAAAMKWKTKSTKEYMLEAEHNQAAKVVEPAPVESSAAEAGGSSEAAAVPSDPSYFQLNRPKQYKSMTLYEKYKFEQQLCDSLREYVANEKKKIEHFDHRRWKKNWLFFRQQGLTFVCFYIASYLFCLTSLYLMFSTGTWKKGVVFDTAFIATQGCLDRDEFYKQVEAWDSYANFGFAFVLNEMLELWRFGTVCFIYFSCRGKVIKNFGGRARKPTMFRKFAAES